MSERKWSFPDFDEVHEEHSESHGLTIRWRRSAEHGGIEFQSSEGDKQEDGSICYTLADTPACEWTDEFDKARRFVDGWVKWDGCSHLNFGDEDGYLHLCGGRCFMRIAHLLQRISEIAKEYGKAYEGSDFPVGFGQ